MLYKGEKSESKDVVDPDKFPIWQLKKKADIFYTLWEEV